MGDSLGANLVFVVSTPRAGSTMLGAMLGSHSAMHCPPEPWLLLPLTTLRDPTVRAYAPYGYEMARDAIRQLADDELFAAGIRAMVERIYDRLLRDAGKRVFIDKTPRYFHILPRLDELCPDARQIWINRNPLDVLASLKETWRFSIDELLGDVLSPYTFDATISLKLLADHFERPAPTKLVVRYEELVHKPEPHLRRVCAFLGVDYEPGMLEYGANQALLKQYAAGSMGDKKVLDHGRPHAQSLDRWKHKLSAAELGRILRALGPRIFERLGYESVWTAACALAGIEPASIAPEGELPRIAEQYAAYQGTEKLAVQLAESESDRARRLELIQTLTRRIEQIEGDRAARLAALESMDAEYRSLEQRHTATETEAAARLEIIQRQTARIDQIETDRAARLALIERMGAQLTALEQERTALAGNRDRLQREYDALGQEYEAMERHCAALDQQCAALRARGIAQANDLERCDRNLRAARAALDLPAVRALRRLKLVTYEPGGDVP